LINEMQAVEAAAALARAYAEEGEELSVAHTADAAGPPKIAASCGAHSITMNPEMARTFAKILRDGADRPFAVMPAAYAERMTRRVRQRWRKLAEIFEAAADGAEAAAATRH
jgi:hypothetical protein